MRRPGGGWPALMLIGGGLVLFGAGCTGFVDTITSHEFRLRDAFKSTDSMTVLRTSNDGDARAKAMAKLKEPRKNHGSEAEQDEAIKYLTEGATTDPRPLCRLAAVEALGRFADPRCGPVLLQAYHAASAFPTDVANPIRCEAMTAIGGKNLAEGMTLLAQVATTPRGVDNPNAVRQAGYPSDDELSKLLLGQYDPDAQAARDARLAAVRALGQSKDPKTAELLVPLLDEKDVAMHDRVQEALCKITGRKNVPAEPQAWRAALGMK